MLCLVAFCFSFLLVCDFAVKFACSKMHSDLKGKNTKSKQPLKTDEKMKQNERNMHNKTRKTHEQIKTKIQKRQSTDDCSVYGHSIWHFEELKWIELWHVWGHFWNSLICRACFDDSADVYASLSRPSYILKFSEEFVKWVFAEDEAISAGVKGQFTLQISGCSRADLNGNYVQQRDLYSRRPIFHCVENDRYLFYHGQRQLGCTASLELQTIANQHLRKHFFTWLLRS